MCKMARIGWILLSAVLLMALVASTAIAQQETWQQIGLTGNNLLCAAVAPGNSNLIVAGGTNLYVSTDGGTNWTTKSNLSNVWSIDFGSTANVAYAGQWGGSGLLKSTDGCVTWTVMNSGMTNTVVKVVCVSPSDDNTVFAAVENGLYKTTNGAVNWTNVKSGVNANAVDVAPSNTQVVYMGTAGAGTFKSTNGGTNWTQMTIGTVPTNANCVSMSVDPIDENVVYAQFQSNGSWVSYDGGANWTQITTSFEGFAIVADQLRGGFVYGVGGWTVPQRNGSFGSGGWNAFGTGWNASWFARNITIDPNDSSKIYASSQQGGLLRYIVDVTAPTAATGLTAAVEGSGIRLNWTASPSADCTGYAIYRRTTGSYTDTPYATVSGRTTTTYLDSSGGTSHYYVIKAKDAAQNQSAASNEASAAESGPKDLDVTYIERTPHDCYRYSVSYTYYGPNGVPHVTPGTEGEKRWPNYNETVTFIAHFRNKGTANPGTVNYRWTINGSVAGTGSIGGIAGGAEGTASIPWVWNTNGLDTDHSDQTVKFEIDYDTRITETYEQNNSLTDYIGGVSLLVAMEPALYDALNAMTNLTGTKSAEDWLQKQMIEANANFARSTYTGTAPNGAKERMRIDQIIVGSLPGTDDRKNDGRWYISGGQNYANTFAMTVDGGLVHEWMHQIGVVDLYQISQELMNNLVQTPDAVPNGYTFGWGRSGLMGGGDIAPHTPSPTPPNYLSQHDVCALNKNVGYRRGFYGEYMYDIPTTCNIQVKDASGANLASATVRVFQTADALMSNTPVITGTTNASGILQLTNRAVNEAITTATGHVLHTNPFGTVNVVGRNGIFLVEISKGTGNFDYAYMDITKFNLAYWGGSTSSWTYVINSRLKTSAATIGRTTALDAPIQGTNIVLSWPAITGASSYVVYRADSYLNQAGDPSHLYENWVYRQIGTTTSGTRTFTDNTMYESSRYAICAKDSSNRFGPLSNRLFAPLLLHPRAVGIKSDNTRVVLDPQNGYYLLNQAADGKYIGNFGSVHYHQEYSNFMVLDRTLSRLVFSHPMDYYSDDHSIRISDLSGTAIFEIGADTGSNPGQFYNPTGVAVDYQSNIYCMDSGNNRIQIFNSAGTLQAYAGTAGSGNLQFNNGQGIAVDTGSGTVHTLYVCDQGNHRVQILSYNTVTKVITYVGVLTGRVFTSPASVIVGSTGKVFVTDSGANRVDEFSSGNAWVRAYTTPDSPATGSLSGPTGIVIDNTGKLIVCDTTNRRVVSVTPL